MITLCVLPDGNEMRLCTQHRRVAEITTVRATVPGAQWTCKICTIQRRLCHEPAADGSVLVKSDSGGLPHVVTRIPSGVIYCDCAAWRFQKNVPPAQRRCKHVERSGLAAVAHVGR